jgi:glycosyltransferase involved in cell wall biosynthesis
MKVLVVQRGAREHYLVAVAMARAACLAALVTDWYTPPGRLARWVLGRLGATGKRLRAARSDEIEPRRVIAFRWRSLLDRARRIGAGRGSRFDTYLEADRRFGRRVALARLPKHDVVFIYSYAACEVLQRSKEAKVLSILGQIDPGPVEYRLVAAEAQAWPEYVCEPLSYPEAYFDRLRKEWTLADAIVVNSQWSREALIAERVPPEKIEVAPLGFDSERVRPRQVSTRAPSPVRILWLGQVNIRKGIQYLVEAARLLSGAPVEIVVAGPIQIPRRAVEAAPGNMRWIGAVRRDEVAELYDASDVFVLPTISDGFGITQIEAMAHGLPVITTRHCGDVVETGATGFIVPARDGRAIADAILRFANDRTLSNAMMPRCVSRAHDFSIEVFQARILQVVARRAKTRILSEEVLARESYEP